MKPHLMMLAALALVLGLPLVGYLWPQPTLDALKDSEEGWTWPEAASETPRAELPENLANYWPGKKPTNSTEADPASADSQRGATQHDWKLIGVIRQGSSLSALVQDPQQNIVTLRPGDRLDEQRRVSELKPTSLLWRDDEGGTGELPLYPEPAAE